jgi:threonine dehydrogenase-like Zn-dependent dehydrogenase
MVLGHEAVGQVVETGGAAAGIARGDWVVPMIRRACAPLCIACARGRRDLCVTGRAFERGIFGLHGYFCDYAVDSAADLVRVPAGLLDFAVLIEPLSVVEKAVERALRLRELPPETALVLGAGPIGLLAALALQLRGLDVTVRSLEPRDDPRARLIAAAGLRYTDGEQRADVVIEATGSPQAAVAALNTLPPLGVCAILGSPNTSGEIPYRDMILGNKVIFGSVNASPEAFRQAVDDLGQFDRRVLDGMVRRARFSDFHATVPAPPGGIVKTVHVLD